MQNKNRITNMEQLLDHIDKAANSADQVTLGVIFREIGSRSFGPLLLLAGLTTLAPIIGDIPGVPTMMAAIVFLIGVQLLIERKHFWLPQWLLSRTVSREKLVKALRWMRRPARFVDRHLRPRYTIFIEGVGNRIVAIVCIAIALVMPAMEFAPFTANGAGAALTAFGLSLITRDGILAILALAVTILTFGFVAYVLL